MQSPPPTPPHSRVPDPPSGPRLRRRTALSLFALGPAVLAVTGCATAPDEPDPLEALVTGARSDAALARAVVEQHSDHAEVARAVAQAREDHARALRREIDRVRPPDPDAPKPPAPKPDVPSNGQVTATLREALAGSRDAAAKLVAGAEPHRAGLLGSVAASCASLLEVVT